MDFRIISIFFFFCGCCSLWIFPELISSHSFLKSFKLLLFNVRFILIFSAFLSIAVYFVFKKINQAHAYKSILINIVILIASLLAGIIYSHYRASVAIYAQLPERYDGLVTEITGRIVTLPINTTQNQWGKKQIKQSFLLNVEKNISKNDKEPFTQLNQIKLTYYFPANSNARLLNKNDKITALVKLRSPRHFANPASFDQVRYLLTERINATGYIKKMFEVIPDNQRYQYKSIFSSLREDRILNLAPVLETLETQSVLKALLLGERSAITPEQWSLFKNTGTAHLMAISGLHIGIAAGFGYLFSRFIFFLFRSINLSRLFLLVPRQYIEYLAGSLFAFYYALLSGLSVPTLRALFMLNLYVVLKIARKHLPPQNALSIILLVLLIIDPLNVLTMSFWLSFYSVSILIYFFNIKKSLIQHNDDLSLSPIKKTLNNLYHFLKNLIKTQIAFFLTLPVISSLWTIPFSLTAPVINLIAVPVVTIIIVPLGILSILLSYICISFSKGLLYLIDQINLGLLQQIEKTHRLIINTIPDSTISLSSGLVHFQSNTGSDWAYILITFIISSLLLLIGKGMPGFWIALITWLYCFIHLASDFSFLSNQPPSLGYGDYSVTQLDVGQGTAIVIHTQNSLTLYDAGPIFTPSFNAGEAVIVPYLKSIGINTIDNVILSHGDSDHVGGVSSIHDTFNVKQWYLGGSARVPRGGKKPINESSCNHTINWQTDGVIFRFLHPKKGSHNSLYNENDQSCVLLIEGQNKKSNLTHTSRTLLTGDISKHIERSMIEQLILPKVDIMTAPHHGSKTSSSEIFLSYLNAKYALVSAGFNNRYHHPHPNILNRYEEKGIRIIDSARYGAVRFIYQNGEWQGPFCHRYFRRFFWQSWDNRSTCTAAL